MMLALFTSNVIYSWSFVSPYAYYRCRGLRAAVNQARKQLEITRVTVWDPNLSALIDHGTCWRPKGNQLEYLEKQISAIRKYYCDAKFKNLEQAEINYNNCLKPLPRLPINFINKTY